MIVPQTNVHPPFPAPTLKSRILKGVFVSLLTCSPKDQEAEDQYQAFPYQWVRKGERKQRLLELTTNTSSDQSYRLIVWRELLQNSREHRSLIRYEMLSTGT
ncbi:hypothetical protein MK805_10615 [Shimazuella sp. AN120528]|uniref:hypothetical protein n=1 Tax=Shimazuella soli TaxID=1892854 RepID=UPI001F0DDDA0|nr:hypothetical protein [Shimazuella soli]MCH5585403.1 hypothetical protein [Shimazuella soli]